MNHFGHQNIALLNICQSATSSKILFHIVGVNLLTDKVYFVISKLFDIWNLTQRSFSTVETQTDFMSHLDMHVADYRFQVLYMCIQCTNYSWLLLTCITDRDEQISRRACQRPNSGSDVVNYMYIVIVMYN